MSLFLRRKRILLPLLAFTALAVLLLAGSAAPAHAALVGNTYIVTTTSDGDDGACAVSLCSLRDAIKAANAHAGADTINFNIPGTGVHTINVNSQMPLITDPLIVDGTSEPSCSAPCIELRNSAAGDGLVVEAGNSTVRGLIIDGYNNGIHLRIGGNNTIAGNFLGTNPAGTAARSNNYGIRIDSGSGNTIGGTNAGDRNLISGNVVVGIDIESSSSSNQILGNLIGTDVNGTTALGNLVGIQLNGSSGNTVGGTTPSARNVISGNKNSSNTAGVGVYMVNGASGNVVEGNYIGTSAAGSAAIPNVDALSINGPNNTIGGTSGTTPGGSCTGACNVLSGNTNNGVTLAENSATGNTIQGNFIGTNAKGSGAVANEQDGVLIAGADNNTVGGTTPAARNLISGNIQIGVELGSSASGNLVEGNFIGTNTSGTAALPNGHGAGIGEGVLVDTSATNNTIGGTTAGAGNLISGNIGMGIQIFPGANGNQIWGNLIGTDASGANALGNTTHGVGIHSSYNLIGGTLAGAPNVIAFNGSQGIGVDTGTRNAIRLNSITGNGSKGIALSNGGNNSQGAPTLNSVSSSGGSVTIQGTFNSAANTTFHLDFFANLTCDSSGAGEGQTFLSTADVTTDGSGSAAVNVNFGTTVLGGEAVTATATDPNGNSSAFSKCAIVGGAPPTKPLAPTLVSPSNGQKVATRQVLLTWNASSLATRYIVIVKQGSTSGTVVFKHTVTATQDTTGVLTAGRSYYWRVKACNSLGCKPSTWRVFRIKAGVTLRVPQWLETELAAFL
jgi:CSLREA domain-containing protein